MPFVYWALSKQEFILNLCAPQLIFMGQYNHDVCIYRLLCRAFISDSKAVVDHGFQKSSFAEMMAHYDSSHLLLMSFVTCHLNSSFLLF